MRILVADDHDIIRRGLKQLLTAHQGWDVCAEAKTGREAVSLAEQVKPDIVVMDISMPELNGLEAARRIRKSLPKTEIVILTLHFSDQLVRDIVEAGVRALDERLEEAAATLGAGQWLTLRRIVLPALGPSLAAAAALCWARALGEFGATITFAGNLPGRTQTLPLAVYLELQQRPGVAVLLSLILLALSIAVLFLLRGRWLSPRHR